MLIGLQINATAGRQAAVFTSYVEASFLEAAEHSG
jgi:hypothetical protein